MRSVTRRRVLRDRTGPRRGFVVLLVTGALAAIGALAARSTSYLPPARPAPISRDQAETVFLASLAAFVMIGDSVDGVDHKLTKARYQQLNVYLLTAEHSVPRMPFYSAEYGGEPVQRTIFRLIADEDRLAVALPIVHHNCTLVFGADQPVPQDASNDYVCHWPKGYDPLSDPLLSRNRDNWLASDVHSVSADQKAFLSDWVGFTSGAKDDLAELARLEHFDVNAEAAKLGIGPLTDDDSGR